MDLKQIKELIRMINTSEISNLTIKDKDFSISIDKKTNIQQIQTATIQPTITEVSQNIISPSQEPQIDDNILSPMVGTFYESPSPKSEAFVKVGDTIKKGDVIGIIEAMKIMNEIEAEFDCKVIKILVDNEQPVEYNTPLFKIERL
jgi:acetyl-CoA carboxylase biotin carboxyl carrier protein